MNKAILIIGLPGSGKTFLANSEYVPKGYNLVDDPKDRNLILNYIKQNKNIVITDPHLCNPQNRKKAIDYFNIFGYQVECIFFENNVEKCQKNLIFRNDGRKIGGFESFRYFIPSGVKTREIWQKV